MAKKESKQFAVRLYPKQVEALERIAEYYGQSSLAFVIRMAVDKYIRSEEVISMLKDREMLEDYIDNLREDGTGNDNLKK